MSQEIISEIKNHTGIITLKTEDGLNAVTAGCWRKSPKRQPPWT